jgi:hypothetical protein
LTEEARRLRSCYFHLDGKVKRPWPEDVRQEALAHFKKEFAVLVLGAHTPFTDFLTAVRVLSV